MMTQLYESSQRLQNLYSENNTLQSTIDTLTNELDKVNQALEQTQLSDSEREKSLTADIQKLEE